MPISLIMLMCGLWLFVMPGELPDPVSWETCEMAGIPLPFPDPDKATGNYHPFALKRNLEFLSSLAVRPYRVKVKLSANQLIGTATLTTLNWDQEDEDPYFMHSTSVDNNQLKALSDGLYIAVLQVSWESNATGQRYIQISDNTATVVGVANQPAVSGDLTYQVLTAPVRLVKNGYVSADVLQSSGGNLNVGSIISRFSLYYATQ